MLAEYSKANAERLLASVAVLASTVADSWIDDDSVAYFGVSSRAISDRIDDSGTIRSHDPRRTKRSARQPLEHEQIEMIESRGRHAHAYLSRGNFRDRQIGAVLELVEPAMRGDGECSQGNLERYIPEP